MARVKEYTPAIAMVAVQAGYAGLNILSKLALESGMSPFVLIAYRQIIATIALAPVTFFLERNARIRITGQILLEIFICSFFGATMNQLLYFIGLKHTSSTIACALTNILPAMTFIMAIPFRIETANIKSKSGRAKIIGTVFCVGGSMLMTFYEGAHINLPPSKFHWRYAEKIMERSREASGLAGGGSSGKEILGAVLVVGSCAAWAAWFIVQAHLSRSFSAPYTTSVLMCAMASIECFLVGAVAERKFKNWTLGSDIRLASVLYIGLVGSGFAVSLMTWAIEKRGPLYVSMFSPILLIVVAILDWAILNEKLYVGSALGSVIIVIGLYLVLWGKAKELKNEASHQGVIESEEASKVEQVRLSGYSSSPNANMEMKEVQTKEV
ncbi:WAT1-related protein At1g09380-like [Phalaenopsis equestris]|uniref:WAT1-related protein At1g09380-like n=1 Tax=Phalaenopsis equestris TaxID=78828 RepID=UPI0009E58222|nr:WAT1-related protein At1g09380-like [Phalaenopsis equestris]